jgi:hypothetical protein
MEQVAGSNLITGQTFGRMDFVGQGNLPFLFV